MIQDKLNGGDNRYKYYRRDGWKKWRRWNFFSFLLIIRNQTRGE